VVALDRELGRGEDASVQARGGSHTSRRSQDEFYALAGALAR
jgi:hypothetical protein